MLQITTNQLCQDYEVLSTETPSLSTLEGLAKLLIAGGDLDNLITRDLLAIQLTSTSQILPVINANAATVVTQFLQKVCPVSVKTFSQN